MRSLLRRSALESRLIALKLVLDELGAAPSIASFDDRRQVQKAIYLAQAVGLDLGYTYGWYLRGPYSPPLTRDYYAMAEALEGGDTSADAHVLVPEAAAPLAGLGPRLAPPSDVQLPATDWLELLASLHYLRSIRHLGFDEAEARLNREKPRLVRYIRQASRALAEMGLVDDQGA